MLGAVVVHLYRQLGPRIDSDALDLKTLAVVHRIVRTPRPKNLAVQIHFRTFLRFELVHHFFHVLGFVFVRDQDCVRCLYHHQILHTDERDQSPVGMYITIGCVIQDNVASDSITLCILRQHLPHRRPSAHIVPTCIEGYNHCFFGALHDCIVHRVRWAFGKGFWV